MRFFRALDSFPPRFPLPDPLPCFFPLGAAVLRLTTRFVLRAMSHDTETQEKSHPAASGLLSRELSQRLTTHDATYKDARNDKQHNDGGDDEPGIRALAVDFVDIFYRVTA